MKKKIFILIISLLPVIGFSQVKQTTTPKKTTTQKPKQAPKTVKATKGKAEVKVAEPDTVIKWYTFQQAMELNKKNPKKVFIDLYTDWCGWCKRMDAVTFSNKVIAKYMNEHYYCVKFNAERKDTIVFKGTTFVNANPTVSRSPHQLAVALVKGQLSYPNFVIMDDSMNVIQALPGYKDPITFEPIIKFFGEDAYKKQDFGSFNATFEKEIKE
ncbi:MAG: DUF255 domain-containing protein [Bacteroidales bacterium]|nr:DUF255 domain-containing protein [Bacteroidales bacterium]